MILVQHRLQNISTCKPMRLNIPLCIMLHIMETSNLRRYCSSLELLFTRRPLLAWMCFISQHSMTKPSAFTILSNWELVMCAMSIWTVTRLYILRPKTITTLQLNICWPTWKARVLNKSTNKMIRVRQLFIWPSKIQKTLNR